MAFAFKVGQRYGNRDGQYEVLSIQGDRLKIRYEDGRVTEVGMARQARILESMQDEEDSGGSDADVDFSDNKSRKTTTQAEQTVAELVRSTLQGIAQPYPPDVTDQVFLSIQNNAQRRAYYRQLVKKFGEHTLNSQIGTCVKDLTGLENSGRTAPAESDLIKTYTILVPAQAV